MKSLKANLARLVLGAATVLSVAGMSVVPAQAAQVVVRVGRPHRYYHHNHYYDHRYYRNHRWYYR